MESKVWVVTRHERDISGSEQFKAVYSSRERALAALSSRSLPWKEDGYSQCFAEDPQDPDWLWYVEEIELDDSPLL